jgi:hypothetical protein
LYWRLCVQGGRCHADEKKGSCGEPAHKRGCSLVSRVTVPSKAYSKEEAGRGQGNQAR